ncbi:copper amine oxidase N-terminal domain-containing protein [Paenibacillus ginsengarvi]|uniref:Copper amine oxidase-like N-terminal domain-containing protein n=1 Tax=Paenibacillus ginsengarvi TaxID=400777 RepID=A0A3B0AUJ1_9BACL|nr:copper amine oxidase N-terminal domain-containing protein [Paenibacillus ginsengarvi]RKN64445.1 hypothetical protein D7M11_33855 [Paenibacillus ginsengarvi]
MKKLFMLVCTMLVSAVLSTGAVYAADTGTGQVHWSAAKAFTYTPLHPFTLNWSGDVLDRGGLSLTDLSLASAAKDADLVINRYGAMGAGGIVKLTGQKLEDAAERPRSGYVSSVTLEEDAVYLIKLRDGKLAKLRIDSISEAKAVFTFVVEQAAPASAPGGPEANSAGKQQPGADAKTETGAQAGTKTDAPVPALPPVQSPAPPPAAEGASGSRWSEQYEVPEPEQRELPLSIYLTLDSEQAAVLDKTNKRTEYPLLTAPFLHEGRTMVPLRFIGEALGAKVGWGAEDFSITLSKDPGITIRLWMNSTQAIVNGKAYELDSPPVMRGETAVIPLRFVSEHLNMHVYFDNGRITITDTENPLFEDSPSEVPKQQTVVRSEAADASFFHGKWNVWIPGGYAPTSSVTNGDGSRTFTHSYTPGAAGDWIEISRDGTYRWLDLGKTYEGAWTGDDKLIKLAGGPMESDWSMRRKSDTEVSIFAWGIEYKGTRAE